MAIGLDDIDPDSDGTRIKIQNQLDVGNVDLSSQMWIKSKTDINGFFTLKSVVSFNNADNDATRGKILTIDPESMSVKADTSTGNKKFTFMMIYLYKILFEMITAIVFIQKIRCQNSKFKDQKRSFILAHKFKLDSFGFFWNILDSLGIFLIL